MADGEAHSCGGHSNEQMFQQIYRGEGNLFSDQELLQLVLSFAGRQTDASQLARRLIERFGTLANVLDATQEALEKVEGVRKGTVRLLQILKALIVSEQDAHLSKKGLVRNAEDAAEYLRPYFYHAPMERAYLLVLDQRGRVLKCVHLGDGTADSVNIEFSTIMRNALSRESAGSILAHCHLSGSTEPSQQDLDVTACLQEMLGEVGVSLYDHLIFSDDDYVSLASMGLMNGKENG